MEFSGRIGAVALADLLQWARNDVRSGSLVVRTTRRTKRVHFRDGFVVGCASDDPREYFGQFLLNEGYLRDRELLDLLDVSRKSPGRRLGEVIAEAAVLDETTVAEALRRHLEDRVCDLFLWRHGVFYFESHVASAQHLAPEPVDPMALAMEGSRWVDEEDRIRQVFIHDDVVLKRGPAWPGVDRTAFQQRISHLIQEPIALEDLYRTVGGVEFRFLEAAFDLAVHEVFDIDRVDEARRHPTSTEIPVLDLLLEEAAEEEVLLSGRERSIPLGAVTGCFPVWRPNGGTVSRADRSWLESLDGTRSLGALLPEVEAGRTRCLKVLVDELALGRVALLPEALDPAATSEGGGSGSDEPARRPLWARLFGP